MNRHNNLERIGIHKFGLYVEEELNWCCRELPISDVGVDIFVEEVINANPTGRFLAVQVKSGNSHYYKPKNESFITYYVSNIHYSYWLSLEIPIILAIYSPEYEAIFWQKIDKTTLEKTPDKWKINIPTSQKLTKSSSDDFFTILEENSKKFTIPKMQSDEDLFDMVANIEYMCLATDSLNKQIDDIKNFQKRLNEVNESLTNIGKINHSPYFKQQSSVPLTYKAATIMQALAKRLKNELPIFVEYYITSILAYNKISQLYLSLNIPLNHGTIEDFSRNYSFVRELPKAFTNAIDGITDFKNSAESILALKVKNIETLKTPCKNLINALDLMLLELRDGKVLTESLIDKVNNTALKLNINLS